MWMLCIILRLKFLINYWAHLLDSKSPAANGGTFRQFYFFVSLQSHLYSRYSLGDYDHCRCEYQNVRVWVLCTRNSPSRRAIKSISCESLLQESMDQNLVPRFNGMTQGWIWFLSLPYPIFWKQILSNIFTLIIGNWFRWYYLSFYTISYVISIKCAISGRIAS